MRLLLYGTAKDKSDLEQVISLIPDLCYRNISIENHADYDAFIAELGIGPVSR